MTLRLYAHPLSSFCWKALIALYELEVAFDFEMVDFGDPRSVERFFTVWPAGKMPVLVDEARDVVVPEASLVVEYVDDGRLVPGDRDAAREVRLWDRFFDLHLHVQMQAVINDRLRPAGVRDPFGVGQAKGAIAKAYEVAERRLEGREWAAGRGFSLADCAAAPALHYSDRVVAFRDTHPNLSAYLTRLEARPSVARVLREAQPYAHLYPAEPA